MKKIPYLPLTDEDRKVMLKRLGIGSVEELFADVPRSIYLSEEKAAKLGVPSGKDEIAVFKEVIRVLDSLPRFRAVLAGGGYYSHYVPPVVWQICGRSEFYTAYTPYQPELSQGTLQAIFEYQTFICRLTGMDVANASSYDGGTALADAVKMAIAFKRKRRRVLLSENLNPIYKKVLRTYLYGTGEKVEEVRAEKDTGLLDLGDLKDKLDEDVACVVLQTPNFYGVIEKKQKEVFYEAASAGAVPIASVYPFALALLKPPGELGAEVVVGEGQPLGNHLCYGGPTFGFLAAKEKFLWHMPGRIFGMTRDREGRRSFVMALQAREQHIKRERATSNICSNENLNALAAAVYMALLGREGFVGVARKSAENARRLLGVFERAGFERVHSGPFFNEFLVRLGKDRDALYERALSKGVLLGIKVGEEDLLVAATEVLGDDEFELLEELLEVRK